MPKFNFSAFRRRAGDAVRRITVRPPAALHSGSPAAEARDRDLVFGLSPARVPNLRQLRYIALVLQPRDRLWLRVCGTVALMAAIALTVRFLYRHTAPIPSHGGSVTVAMIGAPQYLNPALARGNSTDQSLTNLVFRGLTAYDRKLGVTNHLAESIVTSDEGKTVTATLRPNLQWSDGQALTSRDIVYTFSTIADPDYKSTLFPIWQTITVEAKDARTAVFHLPKANPSFPAMLTVGLMPEHVWSDASPATFALAETNLKPVSNGPYKFFSLTKDSGGTIRSLTFALNPSAYGPKPYLKKIVVKFYEDHDTAVDAFAKDAVDAWSGVTRADVSFLKNHVTTPAPISQLVAVYFNQKTNGAMKSSEVRAALNTAIDREAIIDSGLQGFGDPIDQPILRGYPGYIRRAVPRGNLDQARAALDQAGWTVNAEGIRQKDKQQLAFTLTYLDDPVYAAVAKNVAEQWKKLGGRIELKAVAGSTIQKDIVKPRQYEALLFSQIFEYDADPFPYWDSSQMRDPGFALAIFADKKVDQAVTDAHGQLDAAKRDAALAAFQTAIAADHPATFLYQNVTLLIHNANVRGTDGGRFVNAPDRFLDAPHWYVKTRLGWKK